MSEPSSVCLEEVLHVSIVLKKTCIPIPKHPTNNRQSMLDQLRQRLYWLYSRGMLISSCVVIQNHELLDIASMIFSSLKNRHLLYVYTYHDISFLCTCSSRKELKSTALLHFIRFSHHFEKPSTVLEGINAISRKHIPCWWEKHSPFHPTI